MKVSKSTAFIIALCVISFLSYTSDSIALDILGTTSASMVSYWRFDDGSGTRALDSVDSNTGTVHGATWTTGISGGALSFDGSDDYVLIPDSSNLDLTTQFTLEAWINPASTGLDRFGSAIISKVGGSAGNHGYQFVMAQGHKEIYMLFNGPGESWPSNSLSVALSQPVPINQWSYVVATYDNMDLKIYYNGALIGSKSVGPKNIVNSASNLRISGDDNNHAYFQGLIDEAAVHNIALSAQEIRQRYNTIKAGTWTPPK